MLRVILVCCLLVGAATALAAPALSQRSLLQPGLWWDPAHSGHGFDIHVSGRRIGLLWYTYRSDGEPVWYLASGHMDERGELRAELLLTRWDAGGLQSRAVGEVRLQRGHAEAARLAWTLDGQQAVWRLEPFRLSAQRSESDPSGAYHLPQRSGFGLSLDQQAAWLSAIYYVYDAAGQPSWWLGNRADAGSAIDFERFRGPCPACAASTPTPTARLPAQLRVGAGQAELRFADPAGLLQSEFRELPQPLQRFTVPLAARLADIGLAHFDDPAELERFLDFALLDVGNWPQLPGVDYSPAPVAQPLNLSQHNRVDAGVDEPDRVKSDGRHIYAFASDQYGQLQPRLRIAEILGDGPAVAVRGELALLPEAAESRLDRRELYLADGLLATVSSSLRFSAMMDICPPPPYEWLRGSTRVEIFDRRDALAPRRVWQADIDGYLVDSRRIGNQLYLVQRYTTLLDDFAYGSAEPTQAARNRAILEATPLPQMLPQIRVDGGAAAPLLAAQRVLLPPAAERRLQPDFAVLTRIDLAHPENRESLAVVGGVAAIYASEQAIYLTTSRSTQFNDYQRSDLQPSYHYTSDIHRIALDGGAFAAPASAAVDGHIDPSVLRQPFRLSEHQGKLRVMTYGDFGAQGRNRLSILEPSTVLPGMLRTLSTLPNSAAPAPIGKPGETLHATRFVGDRLYAVTFRQVDPLYVVDLADPAAPAIRGELELPGFSDYLHPLGDDLLLGVGYHVDPLSQLRGGLKLALFDVADAGRPQLLDHRLLGEFGSSSALFHGHHAFSSLALGPERWRLALPARLHGRVEAPATVPPTPNFPAWTQSGLYAYDVVGSGRAARLQAVGSMLIDTPARSNGDYDDASLYARSLLLPSGAIYVGHGAFWSAPWSRLTPPSGPQ